MCSSSSLMEITSEIDGSDSPNFYHDLESPRRSFQQLPSTSSTPKSPLFLRQNQGYEVTDREWKLIRPSDEFCRERDLLRRRIRELESGFSEAAREAEEMKKGLEVSRVRIRKLEAETKEKSEFLTSTAELVGSVENHLLKSIRRLNDQAEEDLEVFPEFEGSAESELEEKPRVFSEEKLFATVKLAEEVESKIRWYIESSEKKKTELERGLVNLTEENRDINGILRVAILEKEAAEKNLKGLSEQKGAPLLQIAGRGLQRVGLGFGSGFRLGFGSTVGVGIDGLTKSEGSGIGHCEAGHGGDYSEEEKESLVSTVEKTMKNLRHKIFQLRTSLEESRSDNERLQRLAEKQAQKLAENVLYISELRDQERVLAQNLDELVMELRETQVEVCRCREACQLEVEAGRHEVEERDHVMAIMKIELKRAKSALAISEGKVKSKEEVAKAAIAAEEAAEKSLRLADRRATELLSRIEQLTHQLEETESAERSTRKLRHALCWPWLAVTDTTTAVTARYVNSKVACGSWRDVAMA